MNPELKQETLDYRVYVRLPLSLRERVAALASEHGVSEAQVVRFALTVFFEHLHSNHNDDKGSQS